VLVRLHPLKTVREPPTAPARRSRGAREGSSAAIMYGHSAIASSAIWQTNLYNESPEGVVPRRGEGFTLTLRTLCGGWCCATKRREHPMKTTAFGTGPA
jgi:hypothetical protein